MHTIKWKKNGNSEEHKVELQTIESAQFLYHGLCNYPPVTYVLWTEGDRLVHEFSRK